MNLPEGVTNRIVLVRHGETAAERGMCYGKLDVSLSANGKRQIKKACRFLSKFELAAIYASPRVRAVESAKIIAVKKNSTEAKHDAGKTAEVSSFSAQLSDADFADAPTQVVMQDQAGGILLPEADLVVSGGRGMKGPENWGLIEDLAKALGAATACSKPVSDVDWRPHHEHVGQTGITVSPNLYIACGISGAIQHLAGVNSSKVIVVINKDPEAPFFKAADYGIVGDVFDVLPKLTAAVKALN